MTETLDTSPSGIARAADLIRAGQTVAFPTETVYGLGADATNGEAVARIFEAKGRPRFNPLIAHVADPEAAAALIALPPMGKALASAFWPGPLTLVAPHRGGVSDLARAGLPTLGVRVPASAVARALLVAVARPVAAPSANPSGAISPTAASHVLSGLSGRIAAVLDAGPCPVGIESTIVGFNEGGTAVLLRAGGLPAEDIEAALGTSLRLPDGEGITAPGQLASHYAPVARLRLDAEGPNPDESWIGFGRGPSGRTLSATGDLREAAAALFATLHAADAETPPGGTIAIAPVPHHGLGRAINDRLARAAAPR